MVVIFINHHKRLEKIKEPKVDSYITNQYVIYYDDEEQDNSLSNGILSRKLSNKLYNKDYSDNINNGKIDIY
jgi:hypothetical protein